MFKIFSFYLIFGYIIKHDIHINISIINIYMNVSIKKNKNRNIIEILFNVKNQMQYVILLLKNIINKSVEPEYTDNILKSIVDNFIVENKTMNNITKLEILLNICDEISNKLITNCCHEFEYDYIDITPDVSERICYCVYCETNFKDCKRKY